MQNKRGLTEQIELMGTLKLITQAYQEISVMRMQRIRDAVLKTRIFLDEISAVFANVKENYRNQVMFRFHGKKKDPKKLLELNKNGKEVAVLISTNSKLNGEIISKVFRDFIAYIQTHEVDVVIVGKVGVQMLQQAGIKKQYTFFELDENNISLESLKPLVLDLVQYKQVNVFYGRFESLMFQNVDKSNLSGDVNEDGETDSKTEKSREIDQFIFEPSIEKILQFFETQIFSSLVKQTVSEAELARYASRIRAMDEAMQHIDKTNKDLYGQRRKLKQIINNKKQLEIVSRVIRH
jgi:ATP synthase F1 gamma subunit